MAKEEQAAEGLTEAERRIAEARQLGMIVLHLSRLGLRSLPEGLGQLTGLLGLDLSDNQLASLPERIGQLTGLELLDLSGNQLTSLPEWLGQLTGLQELYLSGNQLASLPEGLGQLTGLQTLDLRGNQLASLPEWLGQLTGLQTLDLSGNQLASLPEGLGQLTGLQALYLSRNPLASLPEGLGQLTGLQALDLSDNQLASLPEGLLRLTDLKEFFLHWNPGLGLPDEVLGPSWQDVRSGKATPTPPAEILGYYYAHRQAALEEGTEPLMEAKVLVLGEASVGKTCLIAALSEDKRRHELDGRGTSGIVRKPWAVPVKGDTLASKPNARGTETLRLNFWDFGGQEIYHSAHTLFLTRRAVYLIVVSKRDNARQNNLDYWLRMATSFGGPEAVIYVVVNKSDEPVGHPPDEQALLRKYAPQLRGFLHTSCDTLDGIPAAREVIVREALRLEGVRLPVAKSWLATKKSLEKMEEHTLSLQQWAKHCCRKKVTSPEAQRELLHLCDRLGTVRYFPSRDTDPPELRETAILNPEWVTLGIYALFDDPELKKRGGLLDRSQMACILERRQYPSNHQHLIEEVMRRYDLLYDSTEHGAEHRMLIPLMLPDREPAMNWPSEGTLEFVHQYEVVPAGLVPAFMARMHRLLSNDPSPWRHGCVVDIKGCRVRVLGDAEKKQVLISVTGPEAQRREALDQVRFTFESLHNAVENLPVQQLIPVPGHPGAPMLDYEFVRSLEWQGSREFPTKGESFGETILVNVREALDGVRGQASRQKDERQRQVAAEQKHIHLGRGSRYYEGHDQSNHQNIHDGTFHGPVGVNQTFENCYNTIQQVEKEDAKQLLTRLVKAVEVLLPNLRDKKVRDNAERQLELLTDEAAQPEPDKNQLALSGKGLIEAAQTCAALAGPVVQAVQAVLSLFSVGS
jgi:internalin A